MTFQMYDPQQVPYAIQGLPKSHLDIERLEIMRAVHEAGRLAKLERREVKRLRRDIRRMERRNRSRPRRHPLPPAPSAVQDQREEVDQRQG